jgi:hypothetical protein
MQEIVKNMTAPITGAQRQVPASNSGKGSKDKDDESENTT